MDLIASIVLTQAKDGVRGHYEVLVEDIEAIEARKDPIPCCFGEEAVKEKENQGGFSKAELDRRKGMPWTVEEHGLFLQGLDKYGKGDWRSISRNFVVTRTPTQVASHAQKFFIRQNSMNKERRRTSIHDITTATNGGDASSSTQGSTTEQSNGNPSILTSSSSMMYGVEMYGHHPYVMPAAYPLPPSTTRQ